MDLPLWTKRLYERWHVGFHYDSDEGTSWYVEEWDTGQRSRWVAASYMDGNGDEARLQRLVDRANRRFPISARS